MQIMTLGAEPHETVWNDHIRADFATWEVGRDCELVEADGSTREHDRTPPGPDIRWLGKAPPAGLLAGAALNPRRHPPRGYPTLNP